MDVNRATKSGQARDIQIKMEERYDEQDALNIPDAIADWLNATLAGENVPRLEYPTKEGIYWQTLNRHIRSGAVLCMHLNKLRAACGMEPVKFTRKVSSAFVALENLDNFSKGAVEYGILETDTFNSIDLVEGYKGPFLHVINCINQLGIVANNKNFKPYYMEPPLHLRDSSKWAGK